MNWRVPLPFVTALVLLVAVAGCGSSATTSTSLTSPSGVRCQATVNNSSSNFGPSGGTGSITVTVSRECTWSAATQAPWITITSAREGQGEGTVTYRVEPNAEPLTRQGAMVVSDRQVAIGQAAAPCQFDVIGGDTTVPPAGGSMSVEVRTHAACGWTASSEVSWASVSPASAQGTRVAQVNVAPNAAPSPRPIAVLIAGHRVTATQPGATAPAPPPAPPAPTPTPAPPAPPPPTPPPPTPPAPTPPPPPPTPEPPPPPPEPTPVGPIKLEGNVQSVSGSCPLITFTVAGRVVYATSSTDVKGGPCKDIEVGLRVEVEGTLMSDGRVRASKITLRKDDDD